MAKNTTKTITLAVAACKPLAAYITNTEATGGREVDQAKNGWGVDAAKAAAPVVEAILRKLMEDHKATTIKVVAMANAGPEMAFLAAALRLGEGFEAHVVLPYRTKPTKVKGRPTQAGIEAQWDDNTKARFQGLLARATSVVYLNEQVADDREADAAINEAAKAIGANADVAVGTLVDGRDAQRVLATLGHVALNGSRAHNITMDVMSYYPESGAPKAAKVAPAAPVVELW